METSICPPRRSAMRSRCVAAVLLAGATLSVACGGREGTQTRADVSDGAVDDAMEVSTDAGWTQCTSPDGLAVCGGPSPCPNTAEECGGCTAPAPLLGAC